MPSAWTEAARTFFQFFEKKCLTNVFKPYIMGSVSVFTAKVAKQTLKISNISEVFKR